jgi:MFS family permease
LTAVPWGRASDKIGRKPAILIGLTFTLAFTLMWGVSTSLPAAIAIRALTGACNGNGTSSMLSMKITLIHMDNSRHYPNHGSRNGA